jgi:cobalamin biosynthesis Mg chelatase CobN
MRTPISRVRSVHEDVTPQPTEEAQESAQASSVIAQARAVAAQSSQQTATTSAASEQGTTTQPGASAASERATTTSASLAQAPATGAGGMSQTGTLLGVLGGAFAVLAAGGLWRARAWRLLRVGAWSGPEQASDEHGACSGVFQGWPSDVQVFVGRRPLRSGG